MTDSPSDPYAFDPVPSATNRHDGWTPERQRLFIRALSAVGIVSSAARSVGLSRKTAYELLKRAGPESGFAQAWKEALAAYQSSRDPRRSSRRRTSWRRPFGLAATPAADRLDQRLRRL